MEFIENGKPIYLQIADRICDDIAQGKYPPDERIPSVRDCASALQVNANTVMRSYLHLSDKGIIVNKRGIGFFTTPNAPQRIAELQQETFFNNELDYFFSRLQSMGISPDQLSAYYANYLNKA